jgi:hypothetical protein
VSVIHIPTYAVISAVPVLVIYVIQIAAAVVYGIKKNDGNIPNHQFIPFFFVYFPFRWLYGKLWCKVITPATGIRREWTQSTQKVLR